MNHPFGTGVPEWFKIPDSFQRPETPLAGCRAKLDRAQEHLTALEVDIADFLGGDEQPYSYVGEVLPKDGDGDTYYLIRADVRREPPTEWGIVLGEFFHDLRSMLDQLVSRLIEHRGNVPPEGKAGFPIFFREDWSGFEKQCKNAMLGTDPADRAVVKRLQPDPRLPHAERRKHWLSLLHWAWNEDKHRVLHPVYVTGAEITSPEDFPRPVPTADIGAHEVVWQGNMFSAHGHPLALARIEPTGPNPQMEMEGDFSPRIAFTKKAIRPEGLRTILEGSRAVFECFRPEIEGD